MNKVVLAATAASIITLAVTAVFPVQTHTQPVSAAQETKITQCPPDTQEGAYFERGIDQDGNVICGFAWHNACPYSEAVPANDPRCEKAKPTEEQLAPWKPEAPAAQPVANQPTVSPCGAK